MPLDGLVSQSERAAGQALAAFPQIVHVLANPELHLGAHLAEKTGLPLVSLAETAVEDLEDLLSGPQYAEGFILEGFPVDKSSLDCIDGLLSATSPDEHRVLGWTEKDSPTHQAVIDHYVDQGIMWEVPHPTRSGGPEGMKNSLLECLEGLPAFK